MLLKIFIPLSLFSTNYPSYFQSLLYICNPKSSDRTIALIPLVVIYTHLSDQYIDFYSATIIENTKMPCVYIFLQ